VICVFFFLFSPGQDMEVSYFHHYKDNVDWVFVENNVFHNMEKNIYQGSREDVTRRMILLCKAAIEVSLGLPCLVHRPFVWPRF